MASSPVRALRKFVFWFGARQYRAVMSHFCITCLRFSRFMAALCLMTVLAGCGEIGFDIQNAIGSVSLPDRCVDFMHRAFPGSDIAVTSRQVAVTMDTATVNVAGIRRDVPTNTPYARNIGVDCRFTNGVLTSFRWTAGPLLRSTTGTAR